MSKIAIIGAGNGGFSMAADLTLAGHSVNLFEFAEYQSGISAIIDSKTIYIEGNARVGQAKLNLVTTNIQDAIEGVECIFIVTHSGSHEKIADLLAPIIKDGQHIYYFTGNMGSLFLYNKIKDTHQNSLLVEIITLPYAVRKQGGDKVFVYRRTGNLGLSAMPAKNTQKALDIFKVYYPESHAMHNILELAICNSNITAHIIPMLMSISTIEKADGNFNFYKDAYSPCVNKAMYALDKELGTLLKAFSCVESSPIEVIEKRFGMSQEKVLEMRTHWNISARIDGNMRFITEDVQECLIFLSCLGEQFKIPTPITNSLICIFSTLTPEIDLYSAGRTLAKLALNQKSIAELNEFLTLG